VLTFTLPQGVNLRAAKHKAFSICETQNIVFSQNLKYSVHKASSERKGGRKEGRERESARESARERESARASRARKRASERAIERTTEKEPASERERETKGGKRAAGELN
jgi:hypothetical protein